MDSNSGPLPTAMNTAIVTTSGAVRRLIQMQGVVREDLSYECIAHIAEPPSGSIPGDQEHIFQDLLHYIESADSYARPQVLLVRRGAAPSAAEVRDGDIVLQNSQHPTSGGDSADIVPPGLVVSVLAEDLRLIRALSVHVTVRHPGYIWRHRHASLWAPCKLTSTDRYAASGSVGEKIGLSGWLCLEGVLEACPSSAASAWASEAAILVPLPAAYDFAVNEPGSFTITGVPSEPAGDGAASSLLLCRVKCGCDMAAGVGGRPPAGGSEAALRDETKKDSGLAGRLCHELNSSSIASASGTAVGGGAGGIGVLCRACGSAVVACTGLPGSGRIAAAVELPSGQFDLTLHEFMCCEDPVGPMASGEVRARPGVVALGSDCALVAACDAVLASLCVSVDPSDSDASGPGGKEPAVPLSDLAKRPSCTADSVVAELLCRACCASLGDFFLPHPAAAAAADTDVSGKSAAEPLSSLAECRPCDPAVTIGIAPGPPSIDRPGSSILSADLRLKLHRIVFISERGLVRIDAEQEVCAALLQTCGAAGSHRARLRRRQQPQGPGSGISSIEVKVLSSDISVAFCEAALRPVPSLRHHRPERRHAGGLTIRPAADEEESSRWSMRLCARIAFKAETAAAAAAAGGSNAEPGGAMTMPELPLDPDVLDEVYSLLTRRAELLPALGAWRTAFLLK